MCVGGGEQRGCNHCDCTVGGGGGGTKGVVITVIALCRGNKEIVNTSLASTLIPDELIADKTVNG